MQYRVNEIKKFTVIAVPKGLKEDKGLKENMYIGWKAICKSCLKLKGERCKKHTSKLKPKTYTFTKLDAKVQYILDSASKTKKDTNIKKKHIKPKKEGEIGRVSQFEAPIHSSNVMLYSIENKIASRVSIQRDSTGAKLRVLKKLT